MLLSPSQLHTIQERLNYKFHHPHLLQLAFIHRSFVNEHRDVVEHNERIEFLGDAVLGLIVSEYLYTSLPTTPEGELSTIRSRLVEASACCAYLEQLGIAGFLLLGRGEKIQDGRGRVSILADLFEAILGAIYLDGGVESAREFFLERFAAKIQQVLEAPRTNPRGALQDYCQKWYQALPSYELLHATGPDHEKKFEIAVLLQGREIGRGVGTSKKEAQQRAAENALIHLHRE